MSLDFPSWRQNEVMESTMNLAGPEIINLLLDRAQPSRRRTPRRQWASDEQDLPVERTAVRRCRCGVCARCADNARWEEIFARKFADPTYYSRQTLRHASPLDRL
jgi:hypothetical protein